MPPLFPVRCVAMSALMASRHGLRVPFVHASSPRSGGRCGTGVCGFFHGCARTGRPALREGLDFPRTIPIREGCGMMNCAQLLRAPLSAHLLVGPTYAHTIAIWWPCKSGSAWWCEAHRKRRAHAPPDSGALDWSHMPSSTGWHECFICLPLATNRMRPFGGVCCRLAGRLRGTLTHAAPRRVFPWIVLCPSRAPSCPSIKECTHDLVIVCRFSARPETDALVV